MIKPEELDQICRKIEHLIDNIQNNYKNDGREKK